MPIEKKTASITCKVTEQTERVMRLVAKREGKTLSEFVNAMFEPVVDREVEFHLSMATELNLVNVNDISMGYEVNQEKKAMYKRSHLNLAVSN